MKHVANSSSMSHSYRTLYPVLDILKFILAFFVIAEHTAVMSSLTGIGLRISQALLWPAVDIFFVISGFLCFDGAQSIPAGVQRDIVMLHRLAKAARQIFIMYGAWSLIYLPLTIAFTYASGNLNTKFLLDYVRICIFSGLGPASPQLWYLLALGYAYLMLLGAIKHHISTSCLFVISAIIMLFGNFIPFIVKQNHYFAIIWQQTFNDTRNVFFAGLFYVCLGAFIAENKIALAKIKSAVLVITFILGLILAIAINPSTTMPFSALAIVSVVALSIRQVGFTYPKIRTIGVIIYLIHYYIVMVVMFLLARTNIFPDRNIACFLFVSVVTLIIAYVITPFLKKNTIMKLLFHA